MNWKQKQVAQQEAEEIGRQFDGKETQVVLGVQHCILSIAHQGEHLYADVPSNFWKCDKVKSKEEL